MTTMREPKSLFRELIDLRAVVADARHEAETFQVDIRLPMTKIEEQREEREEIYGYLKSCRSNLKVFYGNLNADEDVALRIQFADINYRTNFDETEASKIRAWYYGRS